MKRTVKGLIIISSFLPIMVKAACPPPELHTLPWSCVPTTVKSMSGSNAETKLIQIQETMKADGQMIKTAIDDLSDKLSKILMNGAVSISENNIKLQEINSENKIRQDKVFQQQKLDYMANLKEREVKESRSLLYKDDTIEEMNLIIEALEENGDDMPVRDIAIILMKTFDENPENKIFIPIKNAEGVCSKEEVKKGICGLPKSVTPGQKLLDFFEACTQLKKELIVERRKNIANQSTHQTMGKKVDEGLKQTNSTTAIAKKSREQKDLACTPDQYKNKLCMTDISKEDYQEMVVVGKIIPNGNISPSTMLNPPKIGGLEYKIVDQESREVLEYESLDHTVLEENPDQKVEEVPIVYTYKNSNQIKSSIDFVDNVIGQELITNQNPNDRKKAESAEFQARYLNRIASLNIARKVMYESIEKRTGEKLGEKWQSDPNLSDFDQRNPVKESVMGAGELDKLQSKVDDTYALMEMYKDDIKSAINRAKVEESPSQYWDKENLEVIKLQNKILFLQILQNENIELLKAAQLANKANSVENVIYMKQLRQGN